MQILDCMGRFLDANHIDTKGGSICCKVYRKNIAGFKVIALTIVEAIFSSITLRANLFRKSADIRKTMILD